MVLILTPCYFQHNWKFFSQNFPTNGEVCLSEILSYFSSCTSGQLELISQVSKLVKILLVKPATNAEIERSFGAVRQIKTYLSSMMSQQCLNYLMLLHLHKSPRAIQIVSTLWRWKMTLFLAMTIEIVLLVHTSKYQILILHNNCDKL